MELYRNGIETRNIVSVIVSFEFQYTMRLLQRRNETRAREAGTTSFVKSNTGNRLCYWFVRCVAARSNIWLPKMRLKDYSVRWILQPPG